MLALKLQNPSIKLLSEKTTPKKIYLQDLEVGSLSVTGRRRSFPWGNFAYFQEQAVKLQECKGRFFSKKGQ